MPMLNSTLSRIDTKTRYKDAKRWLVPKEREVINEALEHFMEYMNDHLPRDDGPNDAKFDIISDFHSALNPTKQ